MTTKKQRREKVAQKRARFDEETRVMGLEAQRKDRDRAARSKAQAEAARKARTRTLEEASEAMLPTVAQTLANADASYGINVTRNA